ncbi:MAG: DUF11 domain-containing protein [Thermodesulfobacteriota bacterium]|nr:DUF11 domain-containing protein [Thermodesulfobacteriota bacterium]
MKNTTVRMVLLLVSAAMFVFCFAGAAPAEPSYEYGRTLHVILDHHGTPNEINIYDIPDQGYPLVRTGTAYTVNPPDNIGAGGIWTLWDPNDDGNYNDALVFVTFEVLTKAATASVDVFMARTGEHVGVLSISGPQDLAGIVFDQDTKLMYVSDRFTNDLYILTLDVEYDSLGKVTSVSFDAGKQRKVDLEDIIENGRSPIYFRNKGAVGMALDHENDRLFVTDMTNIVRYYDINDPDDDWEVAGSIDMRDVPPRPWPEQAQVIAATKEGSVKAISIAYDEEQEIVYTGGGYRNDNYLRKYDMKTAAADFKNLTAMKPGMGAIGVLVDPVTGLLYVTTGYEGDDLRIFDSDLNQVYRYPDEEGMITMPAGVCIGPPLGALPPILDIVKTDFPDPVIAGNELTYTMRVENTGASTAHNVILTDVYPPETTYVSGGDAHNETTRTVTWNAFDLPAGAYMEFTLTVEVIPTTPHGTTITNTATVDSDETEPVSDPEDTIVAEGAGLVVVKTDDPDPVIAGNELTYSITVENTGGSTAHNVILTDVYPPETTYVSGGDGHNASTRTVTWDAFDLAAGASVDFTLTVEVIPTTAEKTITNTATVDSDETEPVSDPEDTLVKEPAALVVVKTDSPDPVIAGNELTYSITVENTGGSTAHNVMLTDVYPPETTYVSGGDAHNETTRTVTWNAFDLSAGASADFTLTVEVIPTTPDETTINNTATVDSDETEPVSDREDTLVKEPAGLVVVKTDSPDPVIAGNELTYSITVENTGGSTAHNVILTDVYPPETTYVSGGDAHNASTRTVTWNAFDMAAGAAADFTLTVEVIPTTPEKTITNTATVDSDETEPVSDPEDTEVNRPAALEISKTDDPDPVIAGNELTYSISVSNTGGSTAHNVILTDVYPPETTYVSGGDAHNASTRTVTWNAFDLAGGASVDFTLTVEVIPTTPETTITNTATVDSDETDPVSDPEDTKVNRPAALVVVKTDSPDPVIAGNELTYSISVSNTGGSTAHNVILTDVYPSETTYVSGGDAHNASTRTVTWNAFDLAAGASADFTLTVAVIPTTPSMTITNTATVDSDETEPVSDPEDTLVKEPAALVVVKTDSPDPVIAGNELTYSISVSNTGGSTAHNVILTDVYPPETTYVSGGDAHNASTRTVTWNAFDLAAGASADFTLTVAVIPTTPTMTITNTAAVDSDETEPVSDPEDTKVKSRPSLQIEKTDDPDPVYTGEELTYQICVVNTGGSQAKNVVITDQLPPDYVHFVDATEGGVYNENKHRVTWQIGNLLAESEKCVNLVVRVDPFAPAGTIMDTATADSDDTDPVTDIEDTEVIRGRLSVTKDDGLSPDDCVEGDGEISYEICVRNPTRRTVHNVVMTDNLPDEGVFESASDGGTYHASEHTVVWEFASLEPEQVKCVNLRVSVDQETLPGAVLTDRVVANSDETDESVPAFENTLICPFVEVGNRPEFDTVGCDATGYFASQDKIKQQVVENNIDGFGRLINLYSDFANESFVTSAGDLFPDPCFPGYMSAMTDFWNEAVYEWEIVLQMKPESDIDLNIVDCVLDHNEPEIWGGADQTGRYRAAWGELIFVQAGNPHVTVEAIPGPFATPGFTVPFNLDARTLPGLRPVPLVDTPYTSKAFWEEGIVMVMPETGETNGMGQTVYNLKDGDLIRVTITIPSWNTVDIHYGEESVMLKYIGIIGTEYLTDNPCERVD